MSGSRANGSGWVLLGIALLVFSVAVAVYNLWPDITFQAGLVEPSVPYPSKFADAPAGEVPSDATQAIPAEPRVVIPRIAVDVRIYKGDAQRALKLGVYHHAGTAAPGEPGNMVIAGHRNRRQFAPLSYLESGDVILVYWDGAEYGYRVTQVYQVEAVETSVLARGDTEMLTLYTCTPRFLGNKRTVVVAEPLTGVPEATFGDSQ
ncbi:MAG: class D sortase [Coriobacteriia bacterium]|nr:class D sortase [Coriobacteriia bacterium]